MLPFTFTDLFSYPIYLNNKVALEGTTNEYLPFTSVCAPLALPTNETETPISGEESVESMTVPVTVKGC